ncbi:MAG: hypothetical protein IKG98_00935 [Ruminococcus sp.]|nr:hypothetical protein [Ruminococcus sp.]
MMDNVSMNEDMDANSPEKKKRKKVIIIAFILVLAVISCSFMGLMYKTMIPISWSRFNDKRIEYIEDKLKLDLDNVEPIYYRHTTAQDHIADFDFKVDDYKSFMEDDFHGGAITSHFEEDDKSAAKYVCWVEDMSDVYSKCFDVTFTKVDDGYKAKLYYYRKVGTMSKYYTETTTSQ